MLRYCFLSIFVEFHSVVLKEKLKMPQPIRRQGSHLVFQTGSKNTILMIEALRSCFLSSLVEFCSAGSEKKLKMSQPIRGQGGHLVFQISHLGFPIGQNNTNLVEVIEILLPVKFRSIFCSAISEKSKMSKQIRGLGGNLWFQICQKY